MQNKCIYPILIHDKYQSKYFSPVLYLREGILFLNAKKLSITSKENISKKKNVKKIKMANF